MKKSKKTWNLKDNAQSNYALYSKDQMKTFFVSELDESENFIEFFNKLLRFFQNVKNETYMDTFYGNQESAPVWWMGEDSEKILEYENAPEFFRSLVDFISYEKSQMPQEVWNERFENSLRYFIFNSKIKDPDGDFYKGIKAMAKFIAPILASDTNEASGNHLVAEFRLNNLLYEANSYWKFLGCEP